MAKMKFYLNIEGEKLRTLDDLRDNFFVDSVLEHYHSGKLAKWLATWGYDDKLKQVQAIESTDVRGVLEELGRIFDVEVELELDEIGSDVSVNDFLSKRKNTDNPEPDSGDESDLGIWFRKAAEDGDAGAQNALGMMYKNGQGVEKNEETAVEWFRKAADQGLADAQKNLGDMYCYGYGVEEDDQQAIAWYRKAAAQGHEEAKEALIGLEGLIEMMNESSSSSASSEFDVDDFVASTAAGAAVGAAVGSVIPVVGTAIGATVGGLLGGIFGRDD